MTGTRKFKQIPNYFLSTSLFLLTIAATTHGLVWGGRTVDHLRINATNCGSPDSVLGCVLNCLDDHAILQIQHRDTSLDKYLEDAPDYDDEEMLPAFSADDCYQHNFTSDSSVEIYLDFVKCSRNIRWVDGRLSFRFNFKFSFVAYHYKILVVDGLCPVKPGWNEGKVTSFQKNDQDSCNSESNYFIIPAIADLETMVTFSSTSSIQNQEVTYNDLHGNEIDRVLLKNQTGWTYALPNRMKEPTIQEGMSSFNAVKVHFGSNMTTQAKLVASSSYHREITGFALLPVCAWSTHYVAFSWRSKLSYIAVISHLADTTVTIYGLQQQTTTTYFLKDPQIKYIAVRRQLSADDKDEITGSRIVSDKPIAVISVAIDNEGEPNVSPLIQQRREPMADQLIPIKWWGCSYLLTFDALKELSFQDQYKTQSYVEILAYTNTTVQFHLLEKNGVRSYTIGISPLNPRKMRIMTGSRVLFIYSHDCIAFGVVMYGLPEMSFPSLYARTMGHMSSVQPIHTFTNSMALSGLDEVNIRLYNYNPAVKVNVLADVPKAFHRDGYQVEPWADSSIHMLIYYNKHSIRSNKAMLLQSNSTFGASVIVQTSICKTVMVGAMQFKTIPGPHLSLPWSVVQTTIATLPVSTATTQEETTTASDSTTAQTETAKSQTTTVMTSAVETTKVVITDSTTAEATSTTKTTAERTTAPAPTSTHTTVTSTPTSTRTTSTLTTTEPTSATTTGAGTTKSFVGTTSSLPLTTQTSFYDLTSNTSTETSIAGLNKIVSCGLDKITLTVAVPEEWSVAGEELLVYTKDHLSDENCSSTIYQAGDDYIRFYSLNLSKPFKNCGLNESRVGNHAFISGVIYKGIKGYTSLISDQPVFKFTCMVLIEDTWTTNIGINPEVGAGSTDEKVVTGEGVLDVEMTLHADSQLTVPLCSKSYYKLGDRLFVSVTLPFNSVMTMKLDRCSASPASKVGSGTQEVVLIENSCPTKSRLFPMYNGRNSTMASFSFLYFRWRNPEHVKMIINCTVQLCVKESEACDQICPGESKPGISLNRDRRHSLKSLNQILDRSYKEQSRPNNVRSMKLNFTASASIVFDMDKPEQNEEFSERSNRLGGQAHLKPEKLPPVIKDELLNYAHYHEWNGGEKSADSAIGYVTRLEQDPCTYVHCNNYGTCYPNPDVDQLFVCICLIGYYGTYCENSPCTRNPCGQSSKCVPRLSKPYSHNPMGFVCRNHIPKDIQPMMRNAHISDGLVDYFEVGDDTTFEPSTRDSSSRNAEWSDEFVQSLLSEEHKDSEMGFTPDVYDDGDLSDSSLVIHIRDKIHNVPEQETYEKTSDNPRLSSSPQKPSSTKGDFDFTVDRKGTSAIGTVALSTKDYTGHDSFSLLELEDVATGIWSNQENAEYSTVASYEDIREFTTTSGTLPSHEETSTLKEEDSTASDIEHSGIGDFFTTDGHQTAPIPAAAFDKNGHKSSSHLVKPFEVEDLYPPGILFLTLLSMVFLVFGTSYLIMYARRHERSRDEIKVLSGETNYYNNVDAVSPSLSGSIESDLSEEYRERRDTLNSQMVFLRGFSPRRYPGCSTKEKSLITFSPISRSRTLHKSTSTTVPKLAEDGTEC